MKERKIERTKKKWKEKKGGKEELEEWIIVVIKETKIEWEQKISDPGPTTCPPGECVQEFYILKKLLQLHQDLNPWT